MLRRLLHPFLRSNKNYNHLLLFFGFCILSISSTGADTTAFSTRQQAIDFIDKIKSLHASAHWPNIKPDAFLKNIKENIYSPLDLYQGSNTNFCGYATLTYLPLHDDPVTYVKFMLQLYAEGKALYGKAFIDPSIEIRQAAGTLTFKGKLDTRPADQMWFFCLANHFKGYVNFFNKQYNTGDEDTFWASVNYAKFNRMIRKLFNYDVKARGYDLMHPNIKDIYGYLSEKLKTGTTILYLNNAFLYKKKHNTLRPAIPTHFVVLLGIIKADDVITITYWDYGFRSLRQVTPAFLKKIIFGISHCTKKIANAG